MIHSVVSSRSRLSAKLSLPSIVRPRSAGGLTSRITSLPLAIVTSSPAAGTLSLGQVAGSDQFVALTDCALPSWVASTAIALTDEKSRNERHRKERAMLPLLMTSTPCLKMVRKTWRLTIARGVDGLRCQAETGTAGSSAHATA